MAKEKTEKLSGTKINSSGRRTKIYIKLDQEESEGWEQILQMLSGAGEPVNADELAKAFLMRGANAFLAELREVAQKAQEEQEGSEQEESKLIVPDSEIIVP